jgi:hypothetical protein
MDAAHRWGSAGTATDIGVPDVALESPLEHSPPFAGRC